MPWIISFVASWLVFLLLADFKKLRKNIWGGVISLIFASVVDWGGQQLKLYTFTQVVIPWLGCSVFYKFGPVFNMGVLYVQTVPKNRWLQLLNIIVFTFIFISLELLIININAAQYIHWHFLASVCVDLAVFATLTWIVQNFLRREELLGGSE